MLQQRTEGSHCMAAMLIQQKDDQLAITGGERVDDPSVFAFDQRPVTGILIVKPAVGFG
ncbi:hypothetical protein [Cryobacterium sp. Y57]|uniref:hypothetical protein n=1 Tax=Cryobacterium sp. Y57 TaxID=2048287 RepID=UPI001E3E4F4C|nr:hypothetical protein [Cryobacterium sp. Y57]